MTWSDGQRLGLEQLREIAEASDGHFTVEDAPAPVAEGAAALIPITLTTSHLPRLPGGLPMKARERFLIQIPQRFPHKPPGVYGAHKRFAGFPHVQWGDHLCLYQSPNIEYSPADGMFGFIDRLNEWLGAAARNELDPTDRPLHPPSVAPTAEEHIVVKCNAPAPASDNWHWMGAAHLTKRNRYRLDLHKWTVFDAEFPTPEKDETLGAALMLTAPLPFEYPSTVLNLVVELVKQELSVDLWMRLLRLYTFNLPAGEPLYFIVGAPMRRREAGGEMKAHLAVWRVEPEAAENLRRSWNDDGGDALEAFFAWARDAKTAWCTIYENREELTIRRDVGTVADTLRGKRILLLGCGAIGSPIAEHIVRAGAASVDLVDRGTVSPGILVRQNYTDAQVGFSKPHCLKQRLDSIGTEATVTPHRRDLTMGAFNSYPPDNYDLIFDATAANPVASVLELELEKPISVPIISFAVSARAEHGMVTVRMPGFAGGPIDVDRRAKLAASANERSNAFARAFWPQRGDVELFQPEPGCSEPTFIGSASDMAAHASNLLNVALKRLSALTQSQASVDFISQASLADGQLHKAFTFNTPHKLEEPRHGYRVLIDETACREMTTILAQSSRRNGEIVETGGLMFGAIDESLRTVWLDRVSGPPPDSEASAEKFLCGVEGTQALARHHESASGGSSRFIGIWHSHPVSRPQPSIDDVNAMLQLLVVEHNPPRRILMAILGHAATSPQLAVYMFTRREFQASLPRQGTR